MDLTRIVLMIACWVASVLMLCTTAHYVTCWYRKKRLLYKVAEIIYSYDFTEQELDNNIPVMLINNMESIISNLQLLDRSIPDEVEMIDSTVIALSWNRHPLSNVKFRVYVHAEKPSTLTMTN